MKITRTIAALALAIVALVGCSSNDDEPKASSGDSSTYAAPDDLSGLDEPASAPEDDRSLMEQVYLTNLRTEHPEAFMAVGDQQLIDLGNAICDGFDSGMTFEQASMTALNAGYTMAQGGWLLGSAITAFCPEHDDLF